MNKLPISFYLEPDVVKLSRMLLGKRLMTCIGGALTGGTIIETEAYRGPEDRASHAYRNRRTARTEVMFHKGGICYVYLCYGIHSLFNVVTNGEGLPHAILIRSIAPQVGIEDMMKRRKKTGVQSLCNGPGCVSQALGIGQACNGLSLLGDAVWIETPSSSPRFEIVSAKRIGVDYAKEDANLPWRFLLK